MGNWARHGDLAGKVTEKSGKGVGVRDAVVMAQSRRVPADTHVCVAVAIRAGAGVRQQSDGEMARGRRKVYPAPEKKTADGWGRV